MRKSKKQLALSPLAIIISIIVLIVFGFIGIKGTFDYIYCKELQAAIDKGVIVEAEIVALVHRSNLPQGHGSTYQIMYRYIDEDGIVYENYCGSGDYRTEEEDRKRIGEKVEIYIGGLSKVGSQPLSQAVCYGTKVDVGTDIILMSVFYSLIVLYIIAIIIWCLWFYGKLSFKKKSSVETKDEINNS